jgi:hypothetical protein
MAAIGSLLAVTEVAPDGNLADQIQSHTKLICQESAQISHMFDQSLNKPPVRPGRWLLFENDPTPVVGWAPA